MIADLMLSHRLRRWPNLEPTMGQQLACAEKLLDIILTFLLMFDKLT